MACGFCTYNVTIRTNNTIETKNRRGEEGLNGSNHFFRSRLCLIEPAPMAFQRDIAEEELYNKEILRTSSGNLQGTILSKSAILSSC